MNQLSDWEKLEATALCLDGEALAWYQWKESWKPQEEIKISQTDGENKEEHQCSHEHKEIQISQKEFKTYGP